MKLYEISNDIQTILDGGMIVDHETGEILLDEDSLDELAASFEEKAINVGLAIKNFEAEKAAIQNEEQKLHKRRAIIENKVKRIKDYLLHHMSALEVSKIEDARIELSTRKISKVIITDENVIPKEYVVEELTRTPDKLALRKALKSFDIPGAELIENKTLTLR